MTSKISRAESDHPSRPRDLILRRSGFPAGRKRAGLWVAATLFVLAFSATPASAAEAATPWWHVSSGSRPSVLPVGAGTDEVQKLTISATKGSVILVDLELAIASGFAEGIAFVPYNATVPQMQEALEKIYPSHKVAVSGGPGDEKGTKPYEITFPGQSVELMAAFGTEELKLPGECEPGIPESCPGVVTVAELAKGKSDGQVIVTAANLGDEQATGESVPVSISDRLPAGVEAVAVAGVAGANAFSQSAGPVSCVLSTLSCAFAHALPPFSQIEVLVDVVVKAGAVPGAQNEASVSGGGAVSAVSASHPLAFGAVTPFAVDDYQLGLEEEGGAPDTQAGSHPFQFTTTIAFNENAEAQPAVLPKDLKFNLPAGLVGNPTPLPRCTVGEFLAEPPSGSHAGNLCLPQTAVGVAVVTFNDPGNLHFYVATVPVFNLEPNFGEPARFGFKLPTAPVVIDTAVRTGSDYGITASVSNITQTSGFLRSEVTLWGVPGDPRHDNARGWECLEHARGESVPCSPQGESNPPPFMLMPSVCDGPLQTSVQADSWAAPSQPLTTGASRPLAALDGCSRLPFNPSLTVTPDGTAGSSPTGLKVDQHVPQESLLLAGGLAESSVKGLSVTLPEGVVLNPAAADGLQACSIAQIGLQNGDAPSCPDASKVASVKVKTPLLPEPLEGFAYLAAQNANPFGSLVAIYVFAEDAKEGVRVKAAGEVSENPVTGQITAHFEHDPLFEGAPAATQYLPPVPFEDVEVHFYGGDRAPLGTPASCGSYASTGTFTPWSGEPGEAPFVPAPSTFQITSGPHGAPCASPLPFGPSLTGGSTNIQAGAFSPFTTTITREDGQQSIQSVALHMPPGLSGILAGVKLCPEAQANAGTCGPESLIGETIVSVGLGGNPFNVTGGKVYITEKYGGAPFGLSIVNPAVAGPFDLGKVIVRAKIEVDPHTAQLTITTDTSGPYAIPHILDGIPLQIRHVNVTITGVGGHSNNFTFNPTSCNPMSITGNIGSAGGATAPVSVPFQVTNCKNLNFTPKFTVSTSGKTSRSKGASLSVKLTYPKAPFGSQANIARVKVDLPKQLPSRLTTLQKACTAAQFELNPANCPKASFIGHAKAITPLLPVPLEGPAIFVSHGGEAFPSLIVVLQGYGVTLDLVGSTFISKAGITSSTFKTVPDAPVGSFELTLPEGKYSALAANGNLCKSKLAMPTEFVAQNGAKINESTAISVTGCAKTKSLTRVQKLKAALKVCHKQKGSSRLGCEKAARRKYGPAKRKLAKGNGKGGKKK
jgi:hypothetical protein